VVTARIARMTVYLSIVALRERMGTEPMDQEEFETTFGSLPTDDEG